MRVTEAGLGFRANVTVRAYWYPGLRLLGSAATNGVGTFAGTSGISLPWRRAGWWS